MTEQTQSTGQYPEITVCVLIINPVGQVLLVRSPKWQNCWTLPGGHIELGEPIETALQREIREETGLVLEHWSFLSVQEALFDPHFWAPKHFVFLNYVGYTPSEKVILNDEGDAYQWLSPTDALALSLAPYTRQALRDYGQRPIAPQM